MIKALSLYDDLSKFKNINDLIWGDEGIDQMFIQTYNQNTTPEQKKYLIAMAHMSAGCSSEDETLKQLHLEKITPENILKFLQTGKKYIFICQLCHEVFSKTQKSNTVGYHRGSCCRDCADIEMSFSDELWG